jgi:sulfate-transporting ATPase
VLVISDRWFLDRIATHILAFEGDSQAMFFSNYQEYRPTKEAAAKKPPSRTVSSTKP